MSEHRITLTLKPLTFLDRLWYRRIGITPPLSSSRDSGRWARLVPYRFRRFHQAYAASHGYFWMPCPLCDRPFGGHERWSPDQLIADCQAKAEIVEAMPACRDCGRGQRCILHDASAGAPTWRFLRPEDRGNAERLARKYAHLRGDLRG